MTPWRWWYGDNESEYCSDFATRAEAIAAGQRDTPIGEEFHIIEARSSESTKHEYADTIPFLRTRNHEILMNGPAA